MISVAEQPAGSRLSSNQSSHWHRRDMKSYYAPSFRNLCIEIFIGRDSFVVVFFCSTLLLRLHFGRLCMNYIHKLKTKCSIRDKIGKLFCHIINNLFTTWKKWNNSNGWDAVNSLFMNLICFHDIFLHSKTVQSIWLRLLLHFWTDYSCYIDRSNGITRLHTETQQKNMYD